MDRLRWLIDISPDQAIWLFHGGLLSKYIFEEERYCFVYGQYISTIVLGFSFIEHSLASILYRISQDRIDHVRADNLIKEALKQDLIDHNEYHLLDHIRKLRNPIVHFRQPGDKESVEYKVVMENNHPYAIFEEDARFVMEIVVRLLGEFSEVI